MFEPKGEVSQRQLIYRAINHKATGTVIAYHELPIDREKAVGLRDDVSKLFEREQNRHLVCVHNVGWKIVSGTEHVEAASRRRRQATKKLGRAVQIIESVDRREMSGPERLRADAELINVRTGYGVLRGLAAKKLNLEDVVAWQQEQAS
jgi:hypothetical protein